LNQIFLTKNTDRAFSAEKLAPPNPSCEVCGVARTSIEADLSEATLGDLVEKVLKLGLGYGEDVSILTSQLLYDIDFDDNLEVPLKKLGFGEETFVTIIDEDNEDGDPRLNLVIAVTEK
jgi:ubiquitin-like 1-activating enzyme E1 B